MLRVRTIYAQSAGAAVDYYTRYLTQAPGEVPGLWIGNQATGLRLAGEVSSDDLVAVLEGCDPRTGATLGRALVDRRLADGTVVKAVAGFDATFSAPKSLSVLWALTRDERLLHAHDVAVAAALAHLERYGSTTRVRTTGGRRLHPDSQGLTIAAFRQTTSRADDPQIHTHCVVSAKVQTDAGRWLALDARYLKRHQRFLGGLYQSVLRNELTHRFGTTWGEIERGQAEMAAMPDDLLVAFSKRSDQIDEALVAKIEDFAAREGRDPNQWELAAIRREAAVDTRAHKSGAGVADLTTRWEQEAANVGWTARDLVAAVNGELIPQNGRRRSARTRSSTSSRPSVRRGTGHRSLAPSPTWHGRTPRSPAMSGRTESKRGPTRSPDGASSSTRTTPARRPAHPTVVRSGTNRSRCTSRPKRSSPRRSSSHRGRSTHRPRNPDRRPR